MKVRKLLNKSKKWCKYDWAQDADGENVGLFSENSGEACRWCLDGAIHVCYHTKDGKKISATQERVRKHLAEKCKAPRGACSPGCIGCWNDAPRTDL